MATCASISETWFYLRFPRAYRSYEAFEAEDGIDDRMVSRRVIARMLQEVPLTAKRLFASELPLDLGSLKILDERVTPAEAERWMKESDPDDPNNFFKLTLSEFAVHLGTLCVAALGAAWRYARMPNYFESLVIVEGLEFQVFQAIMKKCSHDFGDERLEEKFYTFIRMVELRRSAAPEVLQ
jgi:hypothetical protein